LREEATEGLSKLNENLQKEIF